MCCRTGAPKHPTQQEEPSLQDKLGKKMLGLALEAGMYDDAYSALVSMPAQYVPLAPSVLVVICLLYTSPSPRD